MTVVITNIINLYNLCLANNLLRNIAVIISNQIYYNAFSFMYNNENTLIFFRNIYQIVYKL